MKLSEMKAIAEKRTKGYWQGWFVKTGLQENKYGEFYPLIHGAAPPHEIKDENNAIEMAGYDADFIKMAANNFDKLLAVVEAAKLCAIDAFPEEPTIGDVLIDHARIDILRNALKELESE